MLKNQENNGTEENDLNSNSHHWYTARDENILSFESIKETLRARRPSH